MSQSTEQFLAELDITSEKILSFEHLSANKDDHTVYVSGSLVEGLGNQCSDIDVFIIGDGPRHQEGIIKVGSLNVAIHHHGKRRVDFEYWTDEHVRRISQKIEDFDLTYKSAAKPLSDDELEFTHRIRIGLPLTDRDRFSAWRSTFDYEKLSKILVSTTIRKIDGCLEDLYGMVDDGDIRTGLLHARNVIALSVTLFNHFKGSTNTKPKWQIRILENYAKQDATARDILTESWKLLFPDSVSLRDDALAKSEIIRTIEFANQVIDYVQK